MARRPIQIGNGAVGWRSTPGPSRRHLKQRHRRRAFILAEARVEREEGPKGVVSFPGILRATISTGGRHDGGGA